MNIEGVTIAEENIDLSVEPKATAAVIAGGKRRTAESDSRTVRRGAAGGA
jgi:hypothetical protein